MNTAVTIMTITIPSVGLALWLQPGIVRTKRLSRQIAFFVLPAGISVALVVLFSHILLQNLTGSVAYARVVATHLLVGTGLLLVVFVQPPTEFWVGGDTLSKDRRPALLSVALFILFIILTLLPFLSAQLGIHPLRPVAHYVIVLALLAGWVLALRALWRAEWFRELAGIAAIEDWIPPWLA